MGVAIGEAAGAYPTLLTCSNCDEEYETDETMTNECPECHVSAWQVENTDPDAPWRDE